MTKTGGITIIGGGLAGLTLGIGLRQRGIPVTIFEAGQYPRHRVCGEFISGWGQGVLQRLGIHEVLIRAGATTARTAAFFFRQAGFPPRPLPLPALCLSRFTLDALLAQLFRQSGGDLREGGRWREEDPHEGMVWANGRRLQPCENGWRWFGLKAHARGVSLTADLEVHAQPRGYVGLCRLDGGRVNVCGLFRRPVAAHEPVPPPAEFLTGTPGTVLHERLARAEFDESSRCSVAGLSLRPQRAATAGTCRIGDALTMIPPVTGNGMSMAFEAAELALGPLAAYCRGEKAWTQARREIARTCDVAFARRLAWARWLQWMMFTPLLRGKSGAFLLRSHWLWRLLFERTR